jgi:hypothetical protein
VRGRGLRAVALSALGALALVAAPAVAEDEAPADEAAAAGEPDAADAAAPDAAPAERDRPIFLVTEIIVDDEVKLEADAARDALALRFGRLKDRIDVRSLGEVKSSLDQAGITQLLGGETDELAKLGEYVEVDRIVFGRIHKVGDVTEVSVRVFNTSDTSMEVAMSRRMRAEAPESMVLTAVDSMADRLAAWAITSYGLDAPSEKADALAKKTLGGLKKKKAARKKAEEAAAPTEAAAPADPWGFLGISGGAIAGLGAGVVGVGAAMITLDQKGEVLVPSIVMGAGGLLFVGGVTAVIVDGLE